MKKYIKPDAEIIKFDIADVITDSGVFNPFAQNAVDEQVYVEGDGYVMTPDIE
ncbi:MAG: hypothetical protein IJA87_08670 [Clostridia bacterium]|nr:hypothetical protein [Clostridia bacterium]